MKRILESLYKRGFVLVRQVAVNSGKGKFNSLVKVNSSLLPRDNRGFERRKSSSVHAKPLPLCFICNNSDSRHFIENCEMFKSFSNELKKSSVINVGRCFNCLALGHVARNCSIPPKCHKCGPKAGNMHDTALHESYGKTGSVNVGALKLARKIEIFFKVMRKEMINQNVI